MNESEKAVSALVIAGGNAAKLLKLQEEPLYQMTFLVKAPIHIPRVRFVTFGRNAEISTLISDVLPQFPFPVCFVGQNSHSWAKLNDFQHFLSNLHIMHVSG